jgi:hypothetical protein
VTTVVSVQRVKRALKDNVDVAPSSLLAVMENLDDHDRDYLTRADKMVRGLVRDGMSMKDAIAVTVETISDNYEIPVQAAEVAAVQSPIIQPDVSGEFPSPADGAVWMLVEHGIPQTVLCGVDWAHVAEGRRGKAPFLSAWQRPENTLRTADAIHAAAVKYPGCNFGSVFNSDTFAFEADTPPAGISSVAARFSSQGGTFTSQLKIASSEGRGHRYYRWVSGIKNVAQSLDATKYGDFSIRVSGEQCVSPGSVHIRTRKQYRVISTAVIAAPSLAEMDFWKSEQVEKKSTSTVDEKGERRLIQHGNMHGAYISEAGSLLGRGYDKDDVVETTVRWMVANGEPPVDEDKVRKDVSNFVKNREQGQPAEATALAMNQQPTALIVALGDPTQPAVPLTPDVVNGIPEFDEAAITGIYRKIVDAACNGTTVPRQYAFLAAKVYIGAMISPCVKFEGMADTSSYYGVPIGISGTGKGLAWQRVVKDILTCGETLKVHAVKIIEGSGDSGAGLMDFFFDSPRDAPVICMIDEAAELGHKASDQKQPEILDAIIRLATKHEFTRVKASKSHKATAGRHHDNAHLSLYMCAQNKEVIASAFPNKRGMGIYERFYCEYSPPVLVGRLPAVDPALAGEIWQEVQQLQRAGKITIGDGVEDAVDAYWAGLPPDIQTLVRLKSHLMRDVFINAHGRGSKIAETRDWVAAEKNFLRFLKIKAEFFNQDIPDRIGLFIARLKDITDTMRKRLNKGEPVWQVAMSLRDIQTEAHAYRDNQLHTFKTAWSSFAEFVTLVPIKMTNGQTYDKYIPAPDMKEEWWLKTPEQV